MKIAIVSFSFFETSIPLAKQLAGQAEVSLYCCFTRRHLNPPMMNLLPLVTMERGVVDPRQSTRLLPETVRSYLEGSSLQVSVVIAGKGLYDFATTQALARKLNRGGYDVVHLIGHHISFYQLHLSVYLPVKIHTLHEGSIGRVLENSRLKNLLLKRLYSFLATRKIQLVFHSAKEQDAFCATYPAKDNKSTAVIPFGLFDMYRSIRPSSLFHVNPGLPVFLYFGYLLPYKGIDVLLRAAKLYHQQYRSNVLFIVAGKDGMGLGKTKLPPNVMLIDRFLEEEEIVALLLQCKAVLMPYKSVSQSGIPNVAYCFNKPVIGSDLPGISAVVKHGLNGLLFEPGNAARLAERIHELQAVPGLENRLIENIKSHVTDIPGWPAIAAQTMQLYQKVLSSNPVNTLMNSYELTT